MHVFSVWERGDVLLWNFTEVCMFMHVGNWDNAFTACRGMRYIVHVNVVLTVTLDFRYFFLWWSLSRHMHTLCMLVFSHCFCVLLKKKKITPGSCENYVTNLILMIEWKSVIWASWLVMLFVDVVKLHHSHLEFVCFCRTPDDRSVCQSACQFVCVWKVQENCVQREIKRNEEE